MLRQITTGDQLTKHLFQLQLAESPTSSSEWKVILILFDTNFDFCEIHLEFNVDEIRDYFLFTYGVQENVKISSSNRPALPLACYLLYSYSFTYVIYW